MDFPVLWIRHGATELPAGSVCGQIDPLPLLLDDEIASVQDTLRTELPPDIPVTVYSSPLQRCSDLALRLGYHPIVDDRLQELSFGAWEGRRWDQIDREELDHWAQDYVHRSPPGGESMLRLQDRLQSFLLTIQTEQKGPIVIFSHAGVLRALAALSGLSPQQAMEMPVPFVSVFRWEDGSAIQSCK